MKRLDPLIRRIDDWAEEWGVLSFFLGIALFLAISNLIGAVLHVLNSAGVECINTHKVGVAFGAIAGGVLSIISFIRGEGGENDLRGFLLAALGGVVIGGFLGGICSGFYLAFKYPLIDDPCAPPPHTW